MNETPFFILGNPRSGTTLFRLMLSSHPEICIPPECGFAEWLYNQFLESPQTKKNFKTEFARSVLNTKKFETWGLSFEDIYKELRKTESTDYSSLVTCIYKAYARKRGKDASLFGDKNNYYLEILEKIEDIFPNSKKVFIVRDGRDVAASYLNLNQKKINSHYAPTLTNDVEKIAAQWRENAQKVKERATRKDAFSIRYEDLVSQPQITLKSVCDFLNIEYNKIMLNYHKNNDEPDAFFQWKEKTQKPLLDDSIGQYKEILKKSQLIDFEKIANDELKHFKYK